MPMPSDAPVSRPSRFLPLFRRTRRPPFTVHTWEWRRASEAVLEEKQKYRILILSAPIGGGHNAAARVLHAQLSARGHCVTIQDGFRAMSPLLCRLFQWMYPRQLHQRQAEVRAKARGEGQRREKPKAGGHQNP